MPKVGRNDLCYCGSGKKYKYCHWKTDQAATRSRLNVRRARQSLFARMVDFAQRPRFEADYVAAFNLYWDGRRDITQKNSVNRFESTRFWEWFLIDYRSSHDRQRLIDMFRAQSAGYITPEERALLGAWQSARFGLYEVSAALSHGGVRVRDVLREESRDVHDPNFTAAMQPGALYLARLVQHDDQYEFILAPTGVPAEEKDQLIAFTQEQCRLYADAHFGATWNEFLRESNYLFNHYLLNLSKEKSALGGKVVMPTREEIHKTAATTGLATPQT